MTLFFVLKAIVFFVIAYVLFVHIAGLYVLYKIEKAKHTLKLHQERYWSEHYHNTFGTPENWAKTRARLLI